MKWKWEVCVWNREGGSVHTGVKDMEEDKELEYGWVQQWVREIRRDGGRRRRSLWKMINGNEFREWKRWGAVWKSTGVSVTGTKGRRKMSNKCMEEERCKWMMYERNGGDEELYGRVQKEVGEEGRDGEICQLNLWKRKDGSVWCMRGMEEMRNCME